MHVTLAQLMKIFPNLKQDRASDYLPRLNEALDEGKINTPLRVAAFLGQCGHESGEFRYLEELADGWAYDPNVNPKLAAKLGNQVKGDGPLFKGRGIIQLTGRSNYERFSKFMKSTDIMTNPKSVAAPKLAFRAAAWFWTERGSMSWLIRSAATASSRPTSPSPSASTGA
ncbi:glycoside hydrolase family 19 protein [Cystobacter fuscus]